MLYSLFWVIPRLLNFMCRRFGTLSIPSVLFFPLGDSPASEFMCRRFGTFCLFHLLCSFFWVIPRRLNFVCRRLGTLYSTYDDGTDTMFRNVGTYNSDAGESPPRRNTTFQVVFAVTINTDNEGQTVPKFLFPSSSLASKYLPDTALRHWKLALLLFCWLCVCVCVCACPAYCSMPDSVKRFVLTFISWKQIVDLSSVAWCGTKLKNVRNKRLWFGRFYNGDP
jgi:hypothetical protein